MPFITLLSDYGYSDPYLIQLKSVLWRLNPQAQIVDVAHGIEKYNIANAAFVLSTTIKSFPKETIHVVAVSTAKNFNGRYLLAKVYDQWVLCSDSGFLSLLGEKPSVIYDLQPESDQIFGNDVLTPIAAKLSGGMAPENFGQVTDTFLTLHYPEVRIEGNSITGNVIYVDTYGNVITNIKKSDCLPFLETLQVEIQFNSERLTSINEQYYDQEGGQTVAIFNQFDNLEIATVDGNASRLLGMTYMSQVDVSFY